MLVNIIKSNRKTVSIRVNPDLSVTVRAPKRATNRDIDRILKEKESWIIKQIARINHENEALKEYSEPKLTNAEIRKLADEALKVIPKRVEHYAKIMGVTYGRITIRNQKTRWGSCSSKGNLNFNCLLMLTNPEVIDYVVIHELCHRKEMNHSARFWNEVAKVCPDYRKHVKWLKEEGHLIMRRVK